MASNNNLVTKPPRLASLKPRDLKDLQLDGAKMSVLMRGRGASNANKKNYMPNLNVSRMKNTAVVTSKDTTNSRGRGGKTSRGRGDSKRGGKNNYIQASGVFSEGTASFQRKPTSDSQSERDTISNLSKPTYDRNDINVEINKELVEKFVTEDNFETKLNSIGSMQPVIIPGPNRGIKLEDNIDQTEEELALNSRLNELFSSTGSSLFVVELPTALPGHGEEPATSSDKNDEQAKSLALHLTDIEDGLIGKMVKYASGKRKIILGDTVFDIDMGMEPGFLQEVVSITSNDDERSASMVSLGKVAANLVISPDWNKLINLDDNEET